MSTALTTERRVRLGVATALAAFAMEGHATVPFNPLVQPEGAESALLGVWSSPVTEVAYKGILNQSHQLNRAESGVVLSFARGTRGEVETPADAPESEGAAETDEVPNRSDDRVFGTVYLAYAVNAEANFSSDSVLDGRDVEPSQFAFGFIGGGGDGRGAGAYTYAEVSPFDDSVTFMSDGLETSGTLVGGELLFGLGLGFPIGGRLSMSVEAAQTFSFLEFERSQQAGTVEFPESRKQTDEVYRSRRTSYKVGVDLHIGAEFYLHASVSFRGEQGTTLAVLKVF